MILEDITKAELPAALGLGVVVLLAARLMPQLQPPLKSAVKLGLTLFAESEGEAEAGIIDKLVEPTVENLLDALLAPPGDAARAKVDRSLHHFERRARVHARRWAHDPAHVDRHYHRHIRRLHRRLEHEWQRRGGGDLERYQRVLSRIDSELVV
ncbi:MAG TPA: hypothetical protein VJ770_13660 [Stellaceae bacterium]|nr:hypothetical protein [Stellaceae bacterium]